MSLNCLIMLMAPLVSSSISVDSSRRGGLDFNGDWVPQLNLKFILSGGSTGVETRMVILLTTG